jgi:hypothetical protein
LRLKTLITLYILLTAATAHARVFSFGNNWVAAYFRGTAGMSQVADDAYADTSGTDTLYTDEVEYNFGGELGFSFLLGDRIVLRAGIEGLQTKDMATEGKKSTGAKYFDVESRATVFNPNLTVEYSFNNQGTSRFYSFAGVGTSTVKVSNNYSPTTLANTDYVLGGATPYKETWEASAQSYHFGFGWEASMFDNVTFNFEAGWRMLDINKFKYAAAGDVVRDAGEITVAEGDVVLDNNGKKVDLDMGGAFVGVMFRFYIPPLN